MVFAFFLPSFLGDLGFVSHSPIPRGSNTFAPIVPSANALARRRGRGNYARICSLCRSRVFPSVEWGRCGGVEGRVGRLCLRHPLRRPTWLCTTRSISGRWLNRLPPAPREF